MARTVSADINIGVNVSDADTANTLASAGDSIGVNESYDLNYGTSPAVARSWSALLTLAATPTTLDFTALAAPRGVTETFTSVAAVYLYNTDAANAVTVGNGANPWTPGWAAATNTQPVPAGSRLVWENRSAAPWAVTGTAKTLKLDPGPNTVAVRVIVVGT